MKIIIEYQESLESGYGIEISTMFHNQKKFARMMFTVLCLQQEWLLGSFFIMCVPSLK